uniref:Predicted dehydrogenase n=1 Tax=Candidatus Kentrum sp. LFY TaxID=2126342 RepID=A0A450U785_9GAMM|nr:MAG: Predicted dehydrogenase [Candidatus Kentron sp. LFY]
MSTVPPLNQRWPAPSEPKPIVIIGTGDVVRDAHLPAYAKAGLPVAGLFDIDKGRSQTLAEAFAVDRVFDSLEEAVSMRDVVFDLALPPSAICTALDSLPDGAAVLIQKPMGENLEDARQIRGRCRDKHLTAAINFQLRFSPMMLAVRDAMERGLIGDIIDVDIHLNLRDPWETFLFMLQMDRIEILVHSIHYLDWIRSLLGNPRGVYARTIRHPSFPDLRDIRSSIILDYGDATRCCLSLNHTHEFGSRHELSRVQVDGTQGAVVTRMGVNLDYPRGKPDRLEIATKGKDWAEITLLGNWFPDAFMGPMLNLQRFASGEDDTLFTSVEDAFHTMALVEACYESSNKGATPIPN